MTWAIGIAELLTEVIGEIGEGGPTPPLRALAPRQHIEQQRIAEVDLVISAIARVNEKIQFRKPALALGVIAAVCVRV
jgi:hypothetical protein